MIELVKKIHETGWKSVLAITGGGSDAIGHLLRYGGGSATVLDAQVPYSNKAFEEFVGGYPDKFCSAEAARMLAVAAFARARRLTPETPADKLLGLGTSCSLAKSSNERANREHHVYISTQTAEETRTFSARFKPELNREEEEKIVAEEIVCFMAEQCGITKPTKSRNEWQTHGKTISLSETVLIKRVFLGESQATSIILNENATERPELLFPGSFNPPHAKHIEIAKTAHQLTGKMVDFEISISNVDKPPLDYHSINSRINWLRQMCKGQPGIGQVYLTNTPKFQQKADLWPGVKFLCGCDTLKRLSDCRYYPNKEAKYKQWAAMEAQGTKFYIFHRQDQDISHVDPQLLKLCVLVPKDEYEDDGTASSKLRKGMLQ